MSGADLLVAGGTVLRDGVAEAGDVAIAGGRVVASAAPGSPVLDAAGLLVAPGLIDVQVNGAVGVDLTYEPERWPEVASFLPRTGVTSWCPTLITCPLESIARAQASVLGATPEGAAAALGLHLEGPMLSPAYNGAHPVEHQRLPDPALYADWSPATGVALVTIAPELPGALAAIETLVARGIAVSVGHSAAGPLEVSAAADAGARGVTHLFNAMGALHHRELGTVGAALADDRLLCGLIADGLHVHPAVVRLAWDRLGPERTVLVSDAVWALGAPAGPHRLGDTLVVADGSGVRTGDGRLAGSLLGLDDGLRTLLAAGASRADAVAAATATPAALLGLADRGHLRPGAVGDVVLLTPALEVVATVVRGRLAYHRDDVDEAVAAQVAG